MSAGQKKLHNHRYLVVTSLFLVSDVPKRIGFQCNMGDGVCSLGWIEMASSILLISNR